MGEHAPDALRPAAETDDRARLRRVGGRLLGRIRGRASRDGGEDLSKRNGGSAAAWDPAFAGYRFTRERLDRLDRERKDIPGVARAIDLGGAGLQLDEYGKSVVNAKDLKSMLDAMTPEDRERYGPPNASDQD